MQWSIYLAIGNLSYNIQRLEIRSGKIIVGLIPIYKNDFLDVKIKIYYQTIGIITKNKSKYPVLQIVAWPDIMALEKVTVEGMLIIYVNRNIH